MILAIIFLVLFVAALTASLIFTIGLVKTPMIEIDYKKHFVKTGILVAASAIAFLVASFGLLMWARSSQETPAAIDFLHVFQLVVGALFWIVCLLVAIHTFIIHYYGKNIPEQLDKWLFRIQIIGFTASLVFFFIWTNGLAPYLTYPLVNGISFNSGFVTPTSVDSPNIAFYALCILSGAVLVYFICDHFMYKKYGKHGILESTFFVAFPAGIIGARIAYVIGNWAKEFDYGHRMTEMWGMKIWAPLAIWEGGITILGGAIGGIVVGILWFLWRNKGKSIWHAIDMIVPTILIAQAVGRWGNFFNCEVHGFPVDVDAFKWLPEVIWRNAQYSSECASLVEANQMYLPLFFIEAIINLLGYFVIAHVFGKALEKHLEPGDLGAGYIIWYGLTRMFLEPLRDPHYNMGTKGYWSWVWSLIFVAVGALLVAANHFIRYTLRKKNNTYQPKPNDQKVGLISTTVIVIAGVALLVPGIILMINNPFQTVLEFNNFNLGLILLILGVSVLLMLAISLPLLFAPKQNQPDVTYE